MKKLKLIKQTYLLSLLLVALGSSASSSVDDRISFNNIDIVGPSYEEENDPSQIDQILLSPALINNINPQSNFYDRSRNLIAADEDNDNINNVDNENDDNSIAVNARLDRQQQEQEQSPIVKPSNEIYILEDKDYPKSLFERYQGVGQVSGITTLPSSDVAIFHRSNREWNEKTFNQFNNTINDFSKAQENLIKNDTIMIIDGENGGAVTTFGANLFYMPHGIASDDKGNLWVTDVGRHQVMRLPTSMMQIDHVGPNGEQIKRWLPGNLTRIWPDIILGEAFIPGNDNGHFCKPSEITVSSDGRLVFIADGYCNQRVMVFTGDGKFLTSFGEDQNMIVIHSITLIEERNLICVADRENRRILCFKAGLDGNLDSIGELVLIVEYPLGRVFSILSLTPDHMLVSSNLPDTNRYDLAALNPFTSELKQTWTSSDLLAPHSLARTNDGLYAYAADISKDAYKKVFKFNIILRKS